jgi:AcrR family transcriptional regulator
VEATKKECILVEAARAFARWGYKKASIDEIARSAGVAKGTVYLAAESKEDPFYQALHREVRQWTAECSKVIDPRVPADQLLFRLLEASMQHLERRPLVRELLFGEAMKVLPTWSDRLFELRRLGGANLTEVLRLGVRQRVFREELDVDVVAGLLQDLEVSTFLFHALDDALLRDRARVGLDLVLNGLRAAPAPG